VLQDTQRNPSPPFTTSTLQRAASQRLGMGAAATMSAAQTLYEGGDGLGEHLSFRWDSHTTGHEAAPKPAHGIACCHAGSKLTRLVLQARE
jgi:DNA topoisomerase I